MDPNKADGHVMISIHMLKKCDSSSSKPFQLIFKSCIKDGVLVLEKKEANVVLVRKKGDKKTLKNC